MKLQREKSNNNFKGQILAEFVISVGILSIGLVSSLVCINKGLHMAGRATELQAAVYLATEDMERLKNIPYPYPDDPGDSSKNQFDNISVNITASPALTAINRCEYSFDLQRTCATVTDTAGNQVMVQIKVEVFRTGSSQSLVTYYTYRCKDGL